jgi:hypothetical protein
VTWRIGSIALGYDRWWDLADDHATLTRDLLAALDVALAFAKPKVTDEGLRDFLLTMAMSDTRGLTPAMETWVTVLIRELGPPAWAAKQGTQDV